LPRYVLQQDCNNILHFAIKRKKEEGAHEHHFPMTAIYEKHPSPPGFSRLQAIKTVEIYILG
jgi:hypothetical protein